MASNPLGPQTRNLSSNVPIDVFIAVHQLAVDSGVSVSKYVRAIIEHAVKNNTLVRENADSRKAYYDAVLASEPLPNIELEVVPINELQFPDITARAAEPPAKYQAGKNKALKK